MKQQWIIETTTRLYVNQELMLLANSLSSRNEDYLALFDDNTTYLLSIIDLYMRHFSDITFKPEDFPKQFIKKKEEDPVLFKGFELCLYFEQRDRRNSFIFDTLLEDYNVPETIYNNYSYNPCNTLSALKEYAGTLTNKSCSAKLKRIINITQKLLK